MSKRLPELSRLEMSCLSRLWKRGEASVREVHLDLGHEPSYSTVRKIFERLEEKGAVERSGREGKAVLYRSLVPAKAMIRKEIGRFLDTLFGGSAEPLVAHLADMDAVTIEQIQELENGLAGRSGEADTVTDGKSRRSKKGKQS